MTNINIMGIYKTTQNTCNRIYLKQAHSDEPTTHNVSQLLITVTTFQ